MEPGVNLCTQIFLDKLGSYADRKESLGLGLDAWLQYYSFDVVGEFVFAKKLGFLEEGRDVDGMIQAIQGMLVYASIYGSSARNASCLTGQSFVSDFPTPNGDLELSRHI